MRSRAIISLVLCLLLTMIASPEGRAVANSVPAETPLYTIAGDTGTPLDQATTATDDGQVGHVHTLPRGVIGGMDGNRYVPEALAFPLTSGPSVSVSAIPRDAKAFGLWPVLADGIAVLVAVDLTNNQDLLTAVDVASGALLWQQPLPLSYPQPYPTVSQGVVFVTSGTQVLAYELATGQRRWQSESAAYVPQPLAWDHSAPASPDPLGRTVYRIGPLVISPSFSNGNLHAFDAETGRRIWTRSAAWGEQILGIAATSKRLHVLSATSNLQSELVTLDFAANVRWRTALPRQATFLATEDSVYAWKDQSLYALDASDGAKRWTTELPTGCQSRSASTDARFLFLSYRCSGASGMTTVGVRAISHDDGSTVWDQPTGQFDEGTPVVSAEAVWITVNLRLTALNKATGQLLWQSSDVALGEHHAGLVAYAGSVYGFDGYGQWRTWTGAQSDTPAIEAAPVMKLEPLPRRIAAEAASQADQSAALVTELARKWEVADARGETSVDVSGKIWDKETTWKFVQAVLGQTIIGAGPGIAEKINEGHLPSALWDISSALQDGRELLVAVAEGMQPRLDATGKWIYPTRSGVLGGKLKGVLWKAGQAAGVSWLGESVCKLAMDVANYSGPAEATEGILQICSLEPIMGAKIIVDRVVEALNSAQIR